MCKKYFCPVSEKDNVLVYHMRLHRPFQSISYHKGVLNKIQIAAHRITESQNGRGWKGPLWII